jgi:hypothetical protein
MHEFNMGEFMCNSTAKSRSCRYSTLTTLEQKWSGFEVKAIYLALEGVETYLLDV